MSASSSTSAATAGSYPYAASHAVCNRCARAVVTLARARWALATPSTLRTPEPLVAAGPSSNGLSAEGSGEGAAAGSSCCHSAGWGPLTSDSRAAKQASASAWSRLMQSTSGAGLASPPAGATAGGPVATGDTGRDCRGSGTPYRDSTCRTHRTADADRKSDTAPPQRDMIATARSSRER